MATNNDNDVNVNNNDDKNLKDNTKNANNDNKNDDNNNSNNNNTNNNQNNNNINDNSNNNKDEDDKEDNVDELLEIGTLPHLEIDNFYLEQDKIEKECHPVTWSNCDATTFMVRDGPNYEQNGRKAPSLNAIYKVFAIDGYSMKSKINNVSQFTNIDKYIESHKLNMEYDRTTCPLPPLLIINLMFPNYAPGTSKDYDGEGFQLVLYATLSDDVRIILNKYRISQITELPPSVTLLSNFIHAEPKSEWRTRFKVIARVMNLQYTNLDFVTKSMVGQFNAKPFLARTSSSFYHKPGKYFAVDIDAHLFTYKARQGLYWVKSSLNTIIFDAGFVIESRCNDQMPEQILCCARISKIGIDQAKPFPPSLLEKYSKNKQNNTNNNDNNPSVTENTNEDSSWSFSDLLFSNTSNNNANTNSANNTDNNNSSNNNNNNNSNNNNNTNSSNNNTNNNNASTSPSNASQSQASISTFLKSFFG